MRNLFIATGIAAALLAVTPATAQSDHVPDLNLDPVCRGIAGHASGPAEAGGPDLSFSRCVRSELKVRNVLARQWVRFSAASKAKCIGDTTSALSSYTDLLTCLQLTRAAKHFRARHH